VIPLLLATLLSAGLELESDTLALDPATHVAAATDHVRARTQGLDLSCDRAKAVYGEPGTDGKREIVRLELSGKVRAVRRRDGLVVEAAEAVWTHADDRLVLSGDAVARRGVDVLRGARMLVELDSDAVQVESPDVTLSRKSKEPARVTARTLRYAASSSQAVFEQAVKVVHGALEATADRLTVALDGADARARRIERMSLEGAVSIARGRVTARAARAEYDAETQDVVLEGAPVLEQEGDRLEGERIVYRSASGQARVERAVARVRGGR
jgi:lipopolysaccharide transport protein LptA